MHPWCLRLENLYISLDFFFFWTVFNRVQFQNLRSQFFTQQSLLTEVNNQLLSLKKDIKCSRESQLDNISQMSQDNQSTQADVGANNTISKNLIKRAKELIIQKKFLLQLLNAQKDLKLKIASLRYEKLVIFYFVDINCFTSHSLIG